MSSHQLHYQQMSHIPAGIYADKYQQQQQQQQQQYSQYSTGQPISYQQYPFVPSSSATHGITDPKNFHHNEQYHKSDGSGFVSTRPVQKTGSMASFQTTKTTSTSTEEEASTQVTSSTKRRNNTNGSSTGSVIFGFSANEFVDLMDKILEHMIHESSTSVDPQMQLLTSFHQNQAPTVSITKYLERIMKYAHCSDECYILALIYLKRITSKHRNLIISKHSIHRLLITSIMEAIKFFDDRYYNNSHYARVGGVSCQEINQLETEFLTLMDYELHVTTCEFEHCKRDLVQFHNALRNQMISQGSLPYHSSSNMSVSSHGGSPSASPMSTVSSPSETPISFSQPQQQHQHPLPYRANGAFRPYNAIMAD